MHSLILSQNSSSDIEDSSKKEQYLIHCTKLVY